MSALRCCLCGQVDCTLLSVSNGSKCRGSQVLASDLRVLGRSLQRKIGLARFTNAFALYLMADDPLNFAGCLEQLNNFLAL